MAKFTRRVNFTRGKKKRGKEEKKRRKEERRGKESEIPQSAPRVHACVGMQVDLLPVLVT